LSRIFLFLVDPSALFDDPFNPKAPISFELLIRGFSVVETIQLGMMFDQTRLPSVFLFGGRLNTLSTVSSTKRQPVNSLFSFLNPAFSFKFLRHSF